MKITVYCGASLGNDDIYIDNAKQLAKWIVQNEHILVYGGGKAGLMGILADSVLALGGEVIGIIPHFLSNRELAHEGLTELIKVETMSERKDKMIELGDAYLALPGGPGTLEEISEVISGSRIGVHKNPCILFSQNDFYVNLKNTYQSMVDNGFLLQEEFEKVLFTNDIRTLNNFIKNYEAPSIREYKK